MKYVNMFDHVSWGGSGANHPANGKYFARGLRENLDSPAMVWSRGCPTKTCTSPSAPPPRLCFLKWSMLFFVFVQCRSVRLCMCCVVSVVICCLLLVSSFVGLSIFGSFSLLLDCPFLLYFALFIFPMFFFPMSLCCVFV